MCSGIRIIFRFNGKWEATMRNFNNSDTQGPYIGLYAVLVTLDPLRTHVSARPNKCVCHAINELTRYTKITKLDLALTVHQDIAWLYITMDDPEFFI